MELDKIIYDKDTLAAALIEQWNSESETFKAMYPSDTAVSLANIMAGYGAMLQYILVSAMANCYTDTAYTEMGVYQLAQTLGNTLHGNNSAQVNVTITKKNFIGIKTDIPAFTQFKIEDKKFFNPYDIIFPSTTDIVTDIVLLQGERITVSKTTSGIKNERFYFASNFKANNNYVVVKVNGEEWDIRDSLLEFDQNYVLSLESLKTVVLKTDPDGRSYIRFGDGQFGSLPPADSVVEVTYVSNDGSKGNISETEIEGQLDGELIYYDNYGNSSNLDIDIVTSTTAYGGFDKQSLETLRQTSPWIFASGHRAIRRQDYNALLQNKCGYLTSKVWGEYEQSNLVGAYDSLMNNMVYYTGVKSFQYYPTFLIDYVDDPQIYSGSIHSTRGFYGSYNLSVTNNLVPKNTFSYTDDKGKGLLFINDDEKDPRDDLVLDWIQVDQTHAGQALKSGYEMILPEDMDEAIKFAGSGYSVGDELVLLGTNNELVVVVTEVSEEENGEVKAIAWAQDADYNVLNIASEDWTARSNVFDTAYYGGATGTGTGLIVNITNSGIYVSDLVYTNDNRTTTEATPIQYHPISHARSDANDNQYYQSLYSPSLLNPVQIIIHYGFDHALEYIGKETEAIVGIKFKAAPGNVGTFIGTVAVFGSNDIEPSFDNIRNNENWTKLLNRTTLTNPYGNNNDNWTEWLPLNTMKRNEYAPDGKPSFDTYRYYVIEFYSTENNPLISNPLITFSKMKFLYGKNSSVIHYNDNYSTNGKIYLRFPYNIPQTLRLETLNRFPEEWGDLTGIKQTTTYDPARYLQHLNSHLENPYYNSWYTVLILEFTNGYKVPVLVEPDSSEMSIIMGLANIVNTNCNSIAKTSAKRSFEWAQAKDGDSEMLWVNPDNNKTIATMPLTRYGTSILSSDYDYWNQGHSRLYDSNRSPVASVFTDRFDVDLDTMSVTDNWYGKVTSFKKNIRVTEKGYYSLIGTNDFPFYKYVPTVKNITRDNGYRNGNILAYIYKNEGITLPFYVTVNDIDNGIFTYQLEDSSILADNVKLDLTNEVSLDDNLIYTVSDFNILDSGIGYSMDDEFVLSGYNYPISIMSNGNVYATGDEQQTVIGKLDPDAGAIIHNDEIISSVSGTVDNGCHLESNIAYDFNGNMLGCPVMKEIAEAGYIPVRDFTNHLVGYYDSFSKLIYNSVDTSTEDMQILVTEVDADGKVLNCSLLNTQGNVNLLRETQVYITPTNQPLGSTEYFSAPETVLYFRASYNDSTNIYDYDLNGILTSIVTNDYKFQVNHIYNVFRASNNRKIVLTNVTYGTSIGNVIADQNESYIMKNKVNSTCLGLANPNTKYAINRITGETIGYIANRINDASITVNSGDYALYTKLYAYGENDNAYTDVLDNAIIGKVLNTDSSSVTTIAWINKQFVGKPIINGTFYTKTTKGNGSGLVLNIESICNSGINNIPGSGATIKIASENNLSLEGSFVGNRIDTKDINRLDQPIITQYNHFTTFMEYVQPQVTQVGVTLTVSLNTTADLTSSMIIQNIKNNIYKVFEIGPEYIGKGIKISDIYTAVMSVPNVKWCKINYPTENVDISEYEIAVCSYITVIESEDQ